MKVLNRIETRFPVVRRYPISTVYMLYIAGLVTWQALR